MIIIIITILITIIITLIVPIPPVWKLHNTHHCIIIGSIYIHTVFNIIMRFAWRNFEIENPLLSADSYVSLCLCVVAQTVTAVVRS